MLESIKRIFTMKSKGGMPKPPMYMAPSMGYVPPVMLTKGKWVMYRGRVGVVAEVGISGSIELHLVNVDTGITNEVLYVNVNDITFAKFIDIPECRRRGIDPAYAAAYLGYV
jgi:hypothetical protein